MGKYTHSLKANTEQPPFATLILYLTHLGTYERTQCTHTIYEKSISKAFSVRETKFLFTRAVFHFNNFKKIK